MTRACGAATGTSGSSGKTQAVAMALSRMRYSHQRQRRQSRLAAARPRLHGLTSLKAGDDAVVYLRYILGWLSIPNHSRFLLAVAEQQSRRGTHSLFGTQTSSNARR